MDVKYSFEELSELLNDKYVPQDECEDLIEAARSIVVGYEPIVTHFQTEFGGDELYGKEFQKTDEKTERKSEAKEILALMRVATVKQMETMRIITDMYVDSLKWTGNSRTSELELVNYVISTIDSRPSHIHFHCKRLVEVDIPMIIQKCLTVSPLFKTKSVFRVSMKTEMPFVQLLGQLNNLTETLPKFELQKGMITAVLKNELEVHRMLTFEYEKYTNLEHLISNTSIHSMSSRVHFKCKLGGNDNIRANVIFSNDIDPKGKRVKTIDIEQILMPKITNRRHVTFARKEDNIIHEYEIPDNAPFISLSRSKKPIHDLVRYLEVCQENINLLKKAK